MKPALKLTATLGLLAVLGGLGAADYYFSGNEYAAQLMLTDETGETIPQDTPDQDAGLTDAPAGAVAKNTGPTVESIAQEQSLQTSESDDLNLLSQVATGDTQIRTLAILSNGDRAGSVTWVESGEVKNMFNAIKEALLTAFSPQVKDLRDETLQEAGKPVRNILTFMDPVLSDERILFVRVRERLYEFHMTAGKEETMNTFIDALTSR